MIDRLTASLITSLAFSLLLGVPSAPGQTKKKEPPPRPESTVSPADQARLKPIYRAEIVARLVGVGLSSARAEELATKIVNKDKEALETARLIDAVAADLQKADVRGEPVTKVLDEIAARRLTIRGPGSAAGNIAARGIIDSQFGAGASKRLPQGSDERASAVAKAALDAAADMQLAGLQPGDPKYDGVIDAILSGGLVGDQAREVTRGVIDPMMKDLPPPDGGPSTPPAGGPSTPPGSGGGGKTTKDGSSPPQGNGGNGSAGKSSDHEVWIPGGRPPGGNTASAPSGTGGNDTQDNGGSAQGKKRAGGRMDFEDPPPEPSGGDANTWQPAPPLPGSDQKPSDKKSEDDKQNDSTDGGDDSDDGDEENDDDETEDEDPPPADSESSAGTSLDPAGDEAYRAKPTLQGILNRAERVFGRRGQQTTPDPQAEGVIDRSIPIRDRKGGLIGNPGAPGAKTPPRAIDKNKAPKIGPKPGQVDPERTDEHRPSQQGTP